MFSEYETRDYAGAGNGGIVCHCELVTRREREAVFDSAVSPPPDFRRADLSSTPAWSRVGGADSGDGAG